LPLACWAGGHQQRQLEEDNKLQHVMKSQASEKIATSYPAYASTQSLQLASVSVNNPLLQPSEKQPAKPSTTDCFEPMRKWKNYCYSTQKSQFLLRITKVRLEVASSFNLHCSSPVSLATSLSHSPTGNQPSIVCTQCVKKQLVSAYKNQICALCNTCLSLISNSSKHLKCSEIQSIAAQSDLV
jgi:hypothetical protein